MQVIDDILKLADGRGLGYRVLGDPQGKPFFFFHGTPGSRFVLVEEDLIVKIPGLKVILPERPGYGVSDPQPDRRLLDWPKDVAALADHLGIDQFAVGGGSGGGPHALACAHQLPGRVVTTILLSSPSPAGFPGATRGMARGNRVGMFLGRYAPWLVSMMISSYQRKFAEDPDEVIEAMSAEMSEPDRALLKDPEFRATILEDMREAYRQGVRGHVLDGYIAMTTKGWGFDLRDITVPVHAWHGELDTFVTKAMANRLDTEIPNSHVRYVPEAGHLLTENVRVVEEVRQALGL